jgi:hypothetical protein
MSQAWLTIIGLTLDFLGILLFSREWWTALAAERREAEIEARKSQFKPNPMMPRNDGPNQAVFDWMREQQEVRQRQYRSTQARMARWHFYLIALILVAIGFLFQLAGAFPGCCSVLGIQPTG